MYRWPSKDRAQRVIPATAATNEGHSLLCVLPRLDGATGHSRSSRVARIALVLNGVAALG